MVVVGDLGVISTLHQKICVCIDLQDKHVITKESGSSYRGSQNRMLVHAGGSNLGSTVVAHLLLCLLLKSIILFSKLLVLDRELDRFLEPPAPSIRMHKCGKVIPLRLGPRRDLAAPSCKDFVVDSQ